MSVTHVSGPYSNVRGTRSRACGGSWARPTGA
ncbi:hypothetical protein STRAU_1286 [Streptomyces aurantiacus JA 4570]|uniref:Uncharacterized protein n=1 Tax=Streptomyces aurantiacus JA 4570 TaxID=1286094 RepID=S4A4I2_9ACTN|nr:hypothetical protein STRAU_1286 [Streptomyces aurantiacus JA 4570]